MYKKLFKKLLKTLRSNKNQSSWSSLVYFAPNGFFPNRENTTSVFEKIYGKNMWGVNAGSGGGSTPKVVKPYIEYIENFIKDKHITSVIDFGCGDWQFSKFINWNGVNYLGIDIVEKIILENIEKYQKNNISFKCVNVLDDGIETIPNADLIIIKDVLQHLSNLNVNKILNGILSGKYKYALITNDYGPVNIDIQNGDTRPIDLRLKPFNISRAKPVLKFLEKTIFLINCL